MYKPVGVLAVAMVRCVQDKCNAKCLDYILKVNADTSVSSGMNILLRRFRLFHKLETRHHRFPHK